MWGWQSPLDLGLGPINCPVIEERTFNQARQIRYEMFESDIDSTLYATEYMMPSFLL